MGKRYFVQISTDPDVDPRKCAVGMACAAQAVTDGHFVHVFFASHAVKLLLVAYIDALDEKVSQQPGQCSAMLHTLVDGAEGIYCSTGSQAVVGVTPDNAHGVLVGGYELNWSGPPGVVSLSSEPMWFSRINAGKVPAPYLFRSPLDEKCEITLAYLCSYQLDPFCGHLQSSIDTAEAILRVAWPDPQFSG